MSVQTQEARILLAIEAIQIFKQKLSCRTAAKIYIVSESIFHFRMNSVTPINEYRLKVYKLIAAKEETII